MQLIANAEYGVQKQVLHIGNVWPVVYSTVLARLTEVLTHVVGSGVSSSYGNKRVCAPNFELQRLLL